MSIYAQNENASDDLNPFEALGEPARAEHEARIAAEGPESGWPIEDDSYYDQDLLHEFLSKIAQGQVPPFLRDGVGIKEPALKAIRLLEPDPDQLDQFIRALFRHADPKGYISLRTFYDNDETKSFLIKAVPLTAKGGLDYVIEVAVDHARRAANEPKKLVFCPPVGTFSNPDSAGKKDVLEGVAISVDCDHAPQAAREKLERLLGAATIVVRSGGEWTDPSTGEIQPKVHLHWRLSKPASGEGLHILEAARKTAKELVGGDASNVPISHPIPWPGSWHRKREPVLCRIEVCNPDREIELEGAVKALGINPGQHSLPSISNGSCNPFEDLAAQQDHRARDTGKLIQKILAGESYHEPLTQLAARFIAEGTPGGAVVNRLRGFMEETSGPHDERWQSRYSDIPRQVKTAKEKFAKPTTPPGRFIKTSEEFSTFIPPDYLVDGLLVRGFFYSCTALTGGGKTAFAVMLAAHVALGRQCGDMEIDEAARVLYFAGENAMDVKMRWLAMCGELGIDPGKMDVRFVDRTLKFSESTTPIVAEVGTDRYGLIIIDTSAAYLEGDDENSRGSHGDDQK